VTKVSILQAYRAKDLTKKKTAIPYWDGKTSKRIVDSIKKVL